MRRVAGCCWLALALLVSGTGWAGEEELPSKPRPFTAAFMGSAGCYGGLFVRERTISWLIPFSQCQQVPFEVMEQWGEGNERNIVFRLKKRQTNCRFGVIYLQHRDNPDFGILWNVLGFADMEDYTAAKK